MPYVDAGAAHMYYEVHGSGEPLLLLHGGHASADMWCAFYDYVEAFTASYQVIMPEQRGHGRTADVDGPISYLAMAKDTLALLDGLGLENVHIFGYSDGAQVGLQMVLQRPSVARRLVHGSCYLNLDGASPETLSSYTSREPEDTPPPLLEAYKRLSPDGPDHFPVVFEKVRKMWAAEPDVPLEDLANVHCPTLVLTGDRDVTRLEHSLEIYRALPHGQLFVVPGASHSAFMTHGALIARAVLDFLERDLDEVPSKPPA